MDAGELDVGNTSGRQRRQITGPSLAAFLEECSRELREIEALMLATDEALLQKTERSTGEVRDAKGAGGPP
jgi:hypothetical protein